jgi:hypothetical protein
MSAVLKIYQQLLMMHHKPSGVEGITLFVQDL